MNAQSPAARGFINGITRLHFFRAEIEQRNHIASSLFSTEGGLGFINFIGKLMKTKEYPENPVDLVHQKNFNGIHSNKIDMN